MHSRSASCMTRSERDGQVMRLLIALHCTALHCRPSSSCKQTILGTHPANNRSQHPHTAIPADSPPPHTHTPAGGVYTGASLNPARLLGPAIAFNCHWRAVPAYLCGQVLGGVAGALVSWPLYGTGLQLGRWAETLHDKLQEAGHHTYERLQGSA
jgi:hypothetical protein